MRALVYHGPGSKAWEEVPDPQITQATDAVVQVDTTTICGTDLHILKGDVPEVTPGTVLGHEAVGTVLAHLRRRGPEPLLFSIHTFTPSFGGRDRLWDIGVLWNRDPRLAVPLLDLLRKHDHLRVGDNEPYSGKDIAYTLNLHAASAGLPNAAVEIRQDHCETEDELRRWTEILGECLERILRMDHLHTAEMF